MFKKATWVRSALILFILPPAGVYCQEKNINAILTGRIVNVVGLPIEGAEIEFESQFEYKLAKTDADGRYSVALYPTIYRAVVKKWIGKLNYPETELFYDHRCLSYFRETERADFRLEQNQSATLNFIIPEAECIDSAGYRKGTPVEQGMFSNPTDIGPGLRTRYETLIYPPREFGSVLSLVVQFGSRDERGDKIVYGPASGYRLFNEKTPQGILGTPFPGVVFTHGLMTIYTIKAEFDKKKREISAEGKIVIEDGHRRYEVKKLLIKIANQTVAIVTTP